MAENTFRRTAVVCVLLGLGTIALYAPALTFNFVNYEDQLYVVNNPHVNHGLTAGGLGWAFQAGYAGNWHPLTWMSHMLDVHLFGMRAGAQHATNLLLHSINSVLLFLVLRRMTGAFWRSAAVAALFAWHPLHVESVAWIAERKDLLSTFFWILSLGAWLGYVENRKAKDANFKFNYVAALLFFALGLMSKPMVVTLPCVLLLLDWWPLGRLQFGPAPEGGEAPPPMARQISSLVVEKIPFFALSVASSIVTIVAVHRAGVATLVQRLPFKFRFILAGSSYFHYLAKTLWPADLGSAYPYIVKPPKWQLACMAVLLVTITILAFRSWKTRPYSLFGWLWFLGTLFPTLNLVALGGEPMADRYMYIPSIGLFVWICWEVYDMAAASQYCQMILGALGGAALAGCFVLTSFQVQCWRNEESLVSRIAVTDSNFIAHGSYAAFLMRHNQLPKAEAECEKAISISPQNGTLEALLGDILLLQGNYDKAIEHFNLALAYDKSLVQVHVPMGRALLAERRPTDAGLQFKALVDAEPRNFEAHTLLGETLTIQGKTADAIGEFQRSLSIEPNQPDTLNDLAWILATSPHAEFRNGTEAVKLATRACELTHNAHPVLMGTLAAAYAEAGLWGEAVGAAQKAHDLAAAAGEKVLAERNLQLQQFYRAHQPFREKK
jgi:protein O-mannosyl-transferase